MYKRGEGVDRFGDGWSPAISYANPYGEGWGSGVQGGDGSDDYTRILYDEDEDEESEVK